MDLREFLKTLKDSGVDAKSAKIAAERKYGSDEVALAIRDIFPDFVETKVAPVATTVVAPEVRNDAIEIAEICELAGMSERAVSFIKANKTVEEVRAAILEARKTPPIQNVTITVDQKDKTRSLIEGAIILRSGLKNEKSGLSDKEITDLSKNGARSLTFSDMARECLEDVGVSTRGMTRAMIIEKAMSKRGVGVGHSTSDFPYALSAGVEKVALRGYAAADVTWDKWCTTGSLSNYKETSLIDMSGMTEIEEIKTLQPAKQLTLADSKEKATLKDFGGIFVIDNKALVNDDLDLIKAATRLSLAMASKVNKLAYAQLASNMEDGTALFVGTTSGHYNLGTTGAISDTTIAELVALLRKQKDAKSNVMNIAPFNFLVSATKEAMALKYLAPYIPAVDTSANVSAYRGRFNIISDAEIDSQIATTSYFLMANPAMYDTVMVLTLDGNNTPKVTEQESLNGDPLGMSWQISLPVVAKAATWRTMVKNIGA